MALTNGVITALPTPEGYVVDFENPQRQCDVGTYVVAGLGNALALLFLALRIYVKAIVRRNLGLDDGKRTNKPYLLSCFRPRVLIDHLACLLISWVSQSVIPDAVETKRTYIDAGKMLLANSKMLQQMFSIITQSLIICKSIRLPLIRTLAHLAGQFSGKYIGVHAWEMPITRYYDFVKVCQTHMRWSFSST